MFWANAEQSGPWLGEATERWGGHSIAAGDPSLDTKGTSAPSVLARAAVFHGVRRSERRYRYEAKLEFDRMSAAVPKGRVRRRLKRKGERMLQCGSMVGVQQCRGCGDDQVSTARLITTRQLRCCPTCARYLANAAREKARALLAESHDAHAWTRVLPADVHLTFRQVGPRSRGTGSHSLRWHRVHRALPGPA